MSIAIALNVAMQEIKSKQGRVVNSMLHCVSI